MRKIATLLATISLAITGMFASIGTANAATDITRGSSCLAGQTISGSANWNNTYGSPSRGILDYIVLSSPVKLDVNDSSWTSYDPSGNVNAAGPSLESGPWRATTSSAPYKYRLDPDRDNVATVRLYPVRLISRQTCTIKITAAN